MAQGKKSNELYIGAFLLSEPEAGSDATSQHTTAEDMGNYYLVKRNKKLDYQRLECQRIFSDGTNQSFKRPKRN